MAQGRHEPAAPGQAAPDARVVYVDLVPPYPGAGPAISYVGLRGADEPELADSDGSRMPQRGVARCP